MKNTAIDPDVAPHAVIPADAGIPSNQASGFRVEPGMTIEGRALNTATMETPASLARPIRHTPWRARHLHWLMQDLAGVARQPEQDHRTHLRATLEWMCRAQDAFRTTADSGCVAVGFTFGSGWLPANADTTGRLIETLLPAAECLAWPVLVDRAQAMHITQDASWRDAAWRALAWIKRNQRTMGDDLALRDALPSAVPIWSGPAAFGFETLSAKYFADALMMDMVGISIPPEVPGVKHR